MLPGLEKMLPGLEPRSAGSPGREAPPRKTLSVVVHDLRVQIGVILGYSQLLLDEADASLNPEHREFVTLILTAARSLNRLVDEHLDLPVLPPPAAQRRTPGHNEADARPGVGSPWATAPGPGGPAAQEGRLS